MIVVVDSKLGNIGSVLNMFRRLNVPAERSADLAVLARAKALVLPGVGAFDHGMESLQKLGLVEVLNERVLAQKTPVLGICLGMQLLSRRSEEGRLPGLGWIDGDTVRFRFDPQATGLRIPHMGWNDVRPRAEDRLIPTQDRPPRFYFVHSYHLVCDREEDSLATCHYGYDFICAVRRGHIMGVQFHPEKSHRYGMAMLRNFATMVGAC